MVGAETAVVARGLPAVGAETHGTKPCRPIGPPIGPPRPPPPTPLRWDQPDNGCTATTAGCSASQYWSLRCQRPPGRGIEMWTRVAPAHALVVAVLLLAQLGGGTPGRSPVEQIERSVTRPVPQAPAAPVERSPNVWVRDRYLAGSAAGWHVVRARPLGTPPLGRPVLRAAVNRLQLRQRGVLDGTSRRAPPARHA